MKNCFSKSWNICKISQVTSKTLKLDLFTEIYEKNCLHFHVFCPAFNNNRQRTPRLTRGSYNCLQKSWGVRPPWWISSYRLPMTKLQILTTFILRNESRSYAYDVWNLCLSCITSFTAFIFLPSPLWKALIWHLSVLHSYFCLPPYERLWYDNLELFRKQTSNVFSDLRTIRSVYISCHTHYIYVLPLFIELWKLTTHCAFCISLSIKIFPRIWFIAQKGFCQKKADMWGGHHHLNSDLILKRKNDRIIWKVISLFIEFWKFTTHCAFCIPLNNKNFVRFWLIAQKEFRQKKTRHARRSSSSELWFDTRKKGW